MKLDSPNETSQISIRQYKPWRLQPRDHHYLYTRLLLSLPARWVPLLLKAVGKLKRLMQPGRVRQVAAFYADLCQHVPELGEPTMLARRQVEASAFLGVLPPLACYGSPSLLDYLVEVRAMEHMDRALQLNRGVVLVSTHIGAPGTAVALLRRRGLGPLVLRDYQFSRFAGTRHGRHYLMDAETAFLSREQGSNAASVLLRCARKLKNGGVVSYVADAGHGSHVSNATLFGRPVNLRTGILGLAARLAAPIVPAFTWVENGRLVCEFFEVLQPATGQDADAAGQHLATLLETAIRRSPESLHWLAWDQASLLSGS